MFASQPLADRVDLHLRVDARQRGLSGQRLELADAFLRVQDLALQVGQVDRVAIGQRDMADSRGSQVQGGRRAESAGADDQHLGIDDPVLSFDAYGVKQDVAAVAQQLFVVHFRGRNGAGGQASRSA